MKIRPIDLTKPFEPLQFGNQIAIDELIRQAMIAVAVIVVVLMLVFPGLGVLSSLVAPGLILAIWLWLSVSTAQVGRSLTTIGPLLGTNGELAEQEIQSALRRLPVMRWARLLTYHRLAGLRHMQRRFGEAAAICLCLLNQPLKGPASTVRPHLLLMLAEAQLELGNLPGAYHALAHLQQTRLGLTESLQRLALQTRYELAVGAYDAALNRSRSKVELSELMPTPQCATMHAMLATAAHHRGNQKLAGWLWERTRLLTPPKLMDQFIRGQFGVSIVEHDHETAEPA